MRSMLIWFMTALLQDEIRPYGEESFTEHAEPMRDLGLTAGTTVTPRPNPFHKAVEGVDAMWVMQLQRMDSAHLDRPMADENAEGLAGLSLADREVSLRVLYERRQLQAQAKQAEAEVFPWVHKDGEEPAAPPVVELKVSCRCKVIHVLAGCSTGTLA